MENTHIQRRKKPSLLPVLLGVFIQSVVWLIFTAIPAAIQVYQFYGGTVSTFNTIPSWVWFAPLTLYIVYVGGRTIYKYRKELENYNSQGNLFDDTLTAYKAPTRNQLLHRIGVDIQKLSDEFKPIRDKRVTEKHDQYIVAKEIFDKIKEELLPHANLVLLDTPIPEKLNELEKRLTKYSDEIGSLSQDEYDRVAYGKTKEKVPQDILGRITKTRDALNELDIEIDAIIFSIFNDCIGY